jgi:RND family efflux transporter MFP subunit
MPEEATSKVFQLYRIAYSLIFCRSLDEILQVATRDLSKLSQTMFAVIWKFNAESGTLEPGYVQGEGIKTRAVSLGSDYLGEVFRSGKALILKPDHLKQPNKHIQFPKDAILTAAICIPFKGKPELQGVLELVNKSDGVSAFSEEEADFLTKALELVSVAASNMASYEEQTRNQLNAITRLTLLYDIGQIFNSTLELNQLLPIITEKIRDIVDAETCTIWFFEGESIRCGKSTGGYEELFSNYSAKLEEDPAGEVIQTGEGILLQDATEDERFSKRITDREENPVYSYIAAPLECKGKILGTLEVMNRLTGEAYNEEDQFLLNDLSHQAAVSIHNANLLLTERKAKELDALLNISREITSTLNLDKVLLTIVNQSATLIPYDRAAIALIDRSKVELSAVSGKMQVDKKSPEMKDLQQILMWAASLNRGLYVSEFNGKIATDREETREKFKAHFEKTDFKSFVSLPLTDEEGALGILSLESATPYFLDERHLEVAGILANNATVAIRNAQLYRQVPLINLVGPLMQKKAELLKMPQSRRRAMAIGLAILLAVLLIPWNMKIQGDATVFPAKRTPVVTQVEGILKKVPFREGAILKKGTPIAYLDDAEYRLALREKEMQRDVLQKELSRSRSVDDFSAARQHQIQLEQTSREISYYQDQLNRTQIPAPVDGVLITPKVEEKVGSFLKKGDLFCEVADMRVPRVEVDIDEADLGYLQIGQKVRLKMNAYPMKKFHGLLNLLGAQVVSRSPDRYYRIEAQVDNPDLVLKSGMAGKAKIEVGYHSIGYVLLRKPFRFIWKKLWTWLP